MKKILFLSMILGSLLVLETEVRAQGNSAVLDQMVLMKQFLGTWKAELAPDTFIITNNLPFGSGIDCTGKIYTKGQVLDSIKQIYGYDFSSHKYLAAELIKSTPIIEFVAVWFTDKTSGREVYLRDINNYDKALMKWSFEFKNPDTLVQTSIRNNVVVSSLTLTRVKK
jgi:hypothetical protein